MTRGNRLRRELARAVIIASGLMSLFGAVPGAAELPKVAVFDFELIDTSLQGEIEGEQPAEQSRLVMISDQLRRHFADSGRYTVLDTAPLAARIAEAGYLRGCNGCDADLARTLGADLSVTGTVQKVSNLILNINLYIRDVGAGKLVRGASVDIRGNTDNTWSRGVS